MGAFSFWHIMVVVVLAVLLFGRGKVSELMGDVAKGIKSFKRGMAEDDTPAAGAPRIGREAGVGAKPTTLDGIPGGPGGVIE
jgi:sec-independent protein translocase protein TatA